MDRLRSPDTWAVAAPILCAIHCAATPLLVVFIPALALTPAAEAWLLALSAVIALTVLISGIRTHGSPEVFAPVLLGLVVWGGSLAGWFNPIPEPLASSLGAFAVAGGIFWNARLRHRVTCTTCDVEGHAHGGVPARVAVSPRDGNG